MILTFLSLTGMAQNAGTSTGVPSFKVGQWWSYKTREVEPASTFIILKIDVDPKLGKIVHIAVRDLKMKNGRTPEGFSDKIGHMPFSEIALAQSVVKLLKDKTELPDFEEGYSLWKEAFNQKRAGVYTIPLSDAVKITEDGLNQ